MTGPQLLGAIIGALLGVILGNLLILLALAVGRYL